MITGQVPGQIVTIEEATVVLIAVRLEGEEVDMDLQAVVDNGDRQVVEEAVEATSPGHPFWVLVATAISIQWFSLSELRVVKAWEDSVLSRLMDQGIDLMLIIKIQ